MSASDLEAFKRAVDAYNRADVEALMAELDPEVEWHPALPGLLAASAPVYKGYDGMAEMLRDFYEVLDEVHFSYTEVHDLDGRIVAIGHIRTRGKVSGAVTESPSANVAELKDGRGVHLRGYLDPEEALEAAGLKE